MRKNRSTFILLAAGLSTLVCSLQARSEEAPAAPTIFTDVDPDLGDKIPYTPSGIGRVAGSELGCGHVGNYVSAASGTIRFRGNIYRIDTTTRLQKVEMELNFTGERDLYISVHQKQADGTFDRYIGWPANDIKITEVGSGVPQFYGTGMLSAGGVQLVPGDYAIGFAWGSPAVAYGQDGQPYPQPFARGQVLGLTTVNGVTRPVPSDLGTLAGFTGGAYSMRLCFEPVPGACCTTGIGCRDVVPSQCTTADSTFHGERTKCAETPCKFGACCSPCGQCTDDLTPEACALRGGINHWVGAVCPADGSPAEAQLCPAVTGACCRNETCEELCEAGCDAVGGVYRGDGTDCTPNVCKGACCMSVGCSDRTQSSCTTFGGTFKGNGTTCKTLPQNLECGGACCYMPAGGIPICQHVLMRSECRWDAFPSTAYRGDNTQCLEACNFVTPKSCCLPDGTCLNTSSNACTEMSGEYKGTAQCNANSCIVKACCFADGNCRRLTQTGCATFGGTWKATEPDCPLEGIGFCDSSIPTGACCGLDQGACSITTEAACNDLNRIYQGDGTACAPAATTCPGFGSCCRPDGDCIDELSEQYCDLINGDFGGYQGDGSACSGPEVDCEDPGACCTTTNGCLEANQEECNEVGGTFRGAGTSCESCNAPGACCRPSGVCTNNVPRTQCQGPLDQFHEGFTCNNVACLARGACCTADGTCLTARPQSVCNQQPTNFYAGHGTICDDELCARGACCDHGQADCVVTSFAECDAANDDYNGAGVPCEEALCGAGACCNPESTTCTELSQLECFGISGARFSGNGVACESDTCVVGACCLPGGSQTCVVTTRQGCEIQNGVYRGASTLCTTSNICNLCTQSIVSSNPPDCTIDPAARPHDPGSSEYRRPIIAVPIDFACHPQNLTTVDFAVEVYANTNAPNPPAPAAPNIVAVNFVDGDTAEIEFDTFIPAGAFTCVRHIASGSRVCFGSLPGDVNSNAAVTARDIGPANGDPPNQGSLVEHFRSPVPLLPVARCDLDRNGACTPLDILTGIDLLNGAGSFDKWEFRSVPTCPILTP